MEIKFRVYMKEYNCRVCGLNDEDLPWGEDGKTPSFIICNCCGVEYGYEDSTLEGIKKFRAEWVSKGAVWFRPKNKPKKWDLKIQLRNINSIYL